jgi:hypothetical protein
MANINSSDVIDSLNVFRDLMKICFTNNTIPTIELSTASTLKISLEITSISSDIPLTTDIGSTFKDIKNLNDFLKIKLNGTALSTYISVDNFSISNIRTIIESSKDVIPEYKDYLAYLIYFYYYLIILCGIGCINGIASDPTLTTNTLYDQYILHMKNYIDGIRTIDNKTPINNYVTNKNKVTKTSDAFIEQKKDNNKILTEIEAYDGFLGYVYLYIYFIIILLIVTIIFCIIFKDNNNYLIGILILLIIINALFSKYIVIIEGFSSNSYDKDAKINVNAKYKCGDIHLPTSGITNLSKMKYHLCQVLNVTYERFKRNDLPIITKASYQLITENNLYKKLYSQVKSLNINTKDTINLNLLSFYQRKEYVNLFMRIIILIILLLILYNIFGFHYIIVILGIVLFSLIFLIYLYSMKKISRTNYKNMNWNHKYNFN